MAYDRNLSSINRKLLKGSEILQDSIRQRLRSDTAAAVLDIGCGVGVTLLELAWMFRSENVQFAGINKDAGEPLASREDFRVTARQIALAPDPEIDRFRLPDLYFEDATALHFEDESFDVVYASSVLRFVADKAKLVEEVSRVLRPGGVALIRVGSKGWDYPFQPATAAPQLTTYGSRWVLKHGNDLIPLEAYLKLASGRGVDLKLINRPHCVIRITKERRARLDLQLQLVPELCVPMTHLGYGDEDRGLAKGGVRSVYAVPAAQYAALAERGLLIGRSDPAPGAIQRNTGDAPRHTMTSRLWQKAAAMASIAFYAAPMAACGPARSAAIHYLDWRGMFFVGLLGSLLVPSAKRGRLASYKVGQRVNVKGRRKGGKFQAAKIKMVHHQTADDHLEGRVDRVDAAERSIAVLGVTASAVDLTRSDELLQALAPGTRVRVRGRCRERRFVASAVNIVPDSPIVTEEIQGPIESIAPLLGVLRVSGVTVIAGADTKIDRLDAR